MLQSGQDLQQEAEREDMGTILLAAVRALPDPRQQQVLLWGYLAELDDAEIAARLGITRNHVHQLRHRALLGLRSDPALVARLAAYLGDA